MYKESKCLKNAGLALINYQNEVKIILFSNCVNRINLIRFVKNHTFCHLSSTPEIDIMPIIMTKPATCSENFFSLNKLFVLAFELR